MSSSPALLYVATGLVTAFCSLPLFQLEHFIKELVFPISEPYIYHTELLSVSHTAVCILKVGALAVPPGV